MLSLFGAIPTSDGQTEMCDTRSSKSSLRYTSITTIQQPQRTQMR